MKYEAVCVVGSGSEFSGYCNGKSLKIVYNAGDCYRVKEVFGKSPKLNKTIQINAEMCVPICNRFLVRRSGQNKIIN